MTTRTKSQRLKAALDLINVRALLEYPNDLVGRKECITFLDPELDPI